VKSVLVSLGISGSQIRVVGEGAHYPERVPDVSPDGQLLLAQAEQDREVIVQLPEAGESGVMVVLAGTTS
jgi:hypothetical protein